jgi:hypothetical protein
MAASPTPARRRYPRSEAASPARMRECSQKDVRAPDLPRISLCSRLVHTVAVQHFSGSRGEAQNNLMHEKRNRAITLRLQLEQTFVLYFDCFSFHISARFKPFSISSKSG